MCGDQVTEAAVVVALFAFIIGVLCGGFLAVWFAMRVD